MLGRWLAALCVVTWVMGAAGPAAAQDKVRVVATFSILADLARNVGGDAVDVTALVGPDSDAHAYSPSPADAKRLAKSDPHAWQSVANARIYVANIRDGLVKADPAGKAAYEANAVAYLAKLDALEAEVRATIAALPAARRKIITTHDAFGYFGAAYGMEFIAPQGVSTESEVSARDVAKIIRQIKAQKIPAVFMENITDPRLMQRIAEETGAKIGGRLYSDALSAPGGPAPTYIDMMKNNLKEFRGALAS